MNLKEEVRKVKCLVGVWHVQISQTIHFTRAILKKQTNKQTNQVQNVRYMEMAFMKIRHVVNTVNTILPAYRLSSYYIKPTVCHIYLNHTETDLYTDHFGIF